MLDVVSGIIVSMRSQILIIVVLILSALTNTIEASAKPELRGCWVSGWGDGFLTPEQADETIRLAKLANLNTIFVQVRKVGDAYYRSSFEPRATNISAPDDYDPLAYIIEKAHAEGIKVHAWVNMFRVWTGSTPPSNQQHVALRFPGWISKRYDGNINASDGLFLDPGVPEVCDYTLNIVVDIVRNYNVDGVHLDYVRYAGRDYGYASAAVARFNEETNRCGIPAPNDPEWCKWRRDQVTSLVKRIYKAIKQEKPDIIVSAAVVCWGSSSDNFENTSPYLKVHQDWLSWLKMGYVDAVVPMNYKNESVVREAKWYRDWLDAFRRWRVERHIYNGLLFLADSDKVVRQIEACRHRNIAGIVGFTFNATDKRKSLVETLRKTVFSEFVNPPTMPWLASDISNNTQGCIFSKEKH